jgi:hypothetical protein
MLGCHGAAVVQEAVEMLVDVGGHEVRAQGFGVVARSSGAERMRVLNVNNDG